MISCSSWLSQPDVTSSLPDDFIAQSDEHFERLLAANNRKLLQEAAPQIPK